MPDPSTLAIFLTASLALLLTPGPAVLYIVARSIDQGRRAGFASVLGIQLGTLGHVVAAALGVSAVLATSAVAFSLVKYAGAAYLVYLGVRKLLERTPSPEAVTDPQGDRPTRQELWRVFRQGVIVNLLNPKTALFFFAFLPQFVHPEAGPIAGQILLLGAMFVGMAILSDSMYAMLAGTARNVLRRSRVFTWGQKYISGTIYVALGVTTALSGAGSGAEG
ncbi:MAG: LysE family translocator [Anaerolineae bacterium]|nr:LysE family translocator [Anaerolineae bacterium]